MSRPSAAGKFWAPHYAQWLGRTLADHRITRDALANALVTHADRRRDDASETDRVPRSLVGRYLDAAAAITPRRAFDVGEALRELGVPWCCGLSSLFVAGHVADIITFLDREVRWEEECATTDEARHDVGHFAASIVATLPISVLLAPPPQPSETESVASYVQVARQECQLALTALATKQSKTEVARWLWNEAQDRNSMRGAHLTLQGAHAIAIAPVIDFERRRRDAWSRLQEWASQLAAVKDPPPVIGPIYRNWNSTSAFYDSALRRFDLTEERLRKEKP